MFSFTWDLEGDDALRGYSEYMIYSYYPKWPVFTMQVTMNNQSMINELVMFGGTKGY